MDKQANILVVDDDPDMLNYMTLLLRSRGYNVMCAASGQKALEIVASAMPNLMLLDVTMPGMNGYQVCAKLQEKEATAYIPVIFLTALGEEQNKARALAAGAVDYVVKPVDERLLTEKIYINLRNSKRWRKLREDAILPSDFIRFKEYLIGQWNLTGDKKEKMLKLRPKEIYSLAADAGSSPAQVAKMVADFLKVPYLANIKPEEVHMGILPAAFCRSNYVVAINDPAGETSFVLANPFNSELMTYIKDSLGKGQTYRLFVTEPENITRLLNLSPNFTTKTSALVLPEMGMSELEAEARKRYKLPQEKATDAAEKLTETSEPIIMLVNKIIENAYEQKASDIHIEPWEKEIVIRYRIDGSLQIANRLRPASLVRPLVSRIKIMSNLDIAERRMPQDGRIVFKEFSHKKSDFDLRVAIAPMNFGEKVTMRILDKQKSVWPLDQLGFSSRNLVLYRAKIKTPYGLVLHVGPTGSGKSMTLYAAINEIATPHVNIQTIEDPIEYTLQGINQLQVNHDIGLTFQRALRAFLRQDPNIILVGEIRDHETAHIAIEAALTGHLLVSTLHTNDAASTLTRLLEMEIEPFMVSSSLVLICAQRLLRRLCGQCKEAYQANSEIKKLVGVPPETSLTLYHPKGCPQCGGTGYKGRLGCHEILVPHEALRALVNTKGVTAETFKKMAVHECGMTTLYWDAMEKARAGITSVEDVMAKVRRDEFDSRPGWMFTELGLPRPDTETSPETDKKEELQRTMTENYSESEIAELRGPKTPFKKVGRVKTITGMPNGGTPHNPDATIIEKPSQNTEPDPSGSTVPASQSAVGIAADGTLIISQQETMSPNLITESPDVITEIIKQEPAGEASSLTEFLSQGNNFQDAEIVSSLATPVKTMIDLAAVGSRQDNKTGEQFSLLGAVSGKHALNAFQAQLRLLKDVYLRNLPAKAQQIEEMWATVRREPDNWESWENLHRMIHTLIGSGATYGFKEVSSSARQLEAVVKTAPLNKTPPTAEQSKQIETLLSQFKQTCSEAKID
jgi:type IV pilus assembly protein PilB